MEIDNALDLILNKLSLWLESLIKMLPNLFVAIIIMFIGFFIAKKIRNALRPRLQKAMPTLTIANLTSSMIFVVLIALVIFIFLTLLNLDEVVTTALAGAGIIGLALAFAFQDIAANYISGILLAIGKPFKIGELISVDKYEGFVTEVKLRETILKTYQGQFITIPNKKVFQSAIINYTRLGRRRADITGGIRKNNDLRKAQEVALEALKNVPNVISEDTTFLYEKIADDTMNFKIRIWVDSGKFGIYLQFINDVIITLDEAFKENNITMPDDHYTVEFDSDNLKIAKGVIGIEN